MGVRICILRGINVSGKNRILMADLQRWFQELGYGQVVTYIQSGNVVFSAPHDQPVSTNEGMIRDKIRQSGNLDIPVVIRTLEEMNETLKLNPFLKNSDKEADKLHVTFLSSVPEPDRIAQIASEQYLPDEFIIRGRDIYLYCPGGYGNTKLSNSFFEAKFKVTATTRNWATVSKLAEIGNGLG
jgi:uncharacterized protein (DUF1697 family)